MKKYLKIQSKGEIEEEAFSLMGASTKTEDHTKIGMFGSGTKYSLALLMREGINFMILSGKEKFSFEKETVKFRSRSFERIIINGKKTSITTDMGSKDWKGAFPYLREIYSNALDEDEDTEMGLTENPVGLQGYTTYLIELNPDIRDFFDNIGDYFCERVDNCIHVTDEGSIYPNKKQELRLFRKGILGYQNSQMKALYRYNSPNFKINESRIIPLSFMTEFYISKILREIKDPLIITDILKKLGQNGSKYYEYNILSQINKFNVWWEESLASNKFVTGESAGFFEKEELQGRLMLPHAFLSNALSYCNGKIDVLGITSNGKSNYKFVKPTEGFNNNLIEAIDKLKNSKYADRISDPVIKCVKFEDTSIHGMAEKGKILLSRELELHPVDHMATVIIEENEHLITGHEDCSRKFQSHLFRMIYKFI